MRIKKMIVYCNLDNVNAHLNWFESDFDPDEVPKTTHIRKGALVHTFLKNNNEDELDEESEYEEELK